MIITKKQNDLEYLVAEGITASHCFTTRFGGVSTGSQSSLNLAVGRGDSMENVEKNLHILGNALGFDPHRLVMTMQIHSDIVRTVTDADCSGLCHRNYPQCDALVTGTPGVALLVFTADCTPLLFHDPVTGAVGAAHAGWRGTAQGIGARVVEAMVRDFGSNPADIRAAIGPNVGMCHFETDADVPEAMIASYGEAVRAHIRSQGAKFYLDLKAINALSLRRAGITHIEISEDCTMCRPDKYWSHRITGSERGSQGAIIVRKEEAK
jgi:YfiH family protein